MVSFLWAWNNREYGTIEVPLAEMFWWTLFGSGRDKYGTQWMVDGEIVDK